MTCLPQETWLEICEIISALSSDDEKLKDLKSLSSTSRIMRQWAKPSLFRYLCLRMNNGWLQSEGATDPSLGDCQLKLTFFSTPSICGLVKNIVILMHNGAKEGLAKDICNKALACVPLFSSLQMAEFERVCFTPEQLSTVGRASINRLIFRECLMSQSRCRRPIFLDCAHLKICSPFVHSDALDRERLDVFGVVSINSARITSIDMSEMGSFTSSSIVHLTQLAESGLPRLYRLSISCRLEMLLFVPAILDRCPELTELEYYRAGLTPNTPAEKECPVRFPSSRVVYFKGETIPSIFTEYPIRDMSLLSVDVGTPRPQSLERHVQNAPICFSNLSSLQLDVGMASRVVHTDAIGDAIQKTLQVLHLVKTGCPRLQALCVTIRSSRKLGFPRFTPGNRSIAPIHRGDHFQQIVTAVTSMTYPTTLEYMSLTLPSHLLGGNTGKEGWDTNGDKRERLLQLLRGPAYSSYAALQYFALRFYVDTLNALDVHDFELPRSLAHRVSPAQNCPVLEDLQYDDWRRGIRVSE